MISQSVPKLTVVQKIQGLFKPASVWAWFKSVSSLVYAQVAASTAITGAQENATAFDKYYTVKANAPEAGSVIRGRAWGKYTATTGTENHTLALKLGSQAIFTSGNIDPADNDYWMIEFEIVFRTVGASGTIVGWAAMRNGASAAAGTWLHYYLDSTSFDTTADSILAVYMDRQASATDSDSARQDSMIVVSMS